MSEQEDRIAAEHQRKEAARAADAKVEAVHEKKAEVRAENAEVRAEHDKKAAERGEEHAKSVSVKAAHDRKEKARAKEHEVLAHSKDVKGKSGGLKYAKATYARHPVGLTITSSGNRVNYGGSHRFFATLEDAPEEGVIWSCSHGRIDQKGHYTAPVISMASGVMPTGATITAQSRTDSSQRAHFVIKFRTIGLRDDSGPFGYVNSKGDTIVSDSGHVAYTDPDLRTDSTGYPDRSERIGATGPIVHTGVVHTGATGPGYTGHTGYTGPTRL